MSELTELLFADGAAQGPGGGLFSMLLMFGAMFVILYFVMIRPQQKQQKRHQDLIASLKKGDEVVLSSGIIGKVFSVEDKFISLEVADKTRVRVMKQAVQALMPSSAALADASGESQKLPPQT